MCKMQIGFPCTYMYSSSRLRILYLTSLDIKYIFVYTIYYIYLSDTRRFRVFISYLESYHLFFTTEKLMKMRSIVSGFVHVIEWSPALRIISVSKKEKSIGICERRFAWSSRADLNEA